MLCSSGPVAAAFAATDLGLLTLRGLDMRKVSRQFAKISERDVSYKDRHPRPASQTQNLRELASAPVFTLDDFFIIRKELRSAPQ
jgi:hypothetical protein